MVILLYYYDYYYYSLFKKHTFISKKWIKPNITTDEQTVNPHRHTLTTIVGLLLAVLGVKSRTIVNLKHFAKGLRCSFFRGKFQPLTHHHPLEGYRRFRQTLRVHFFFLREGVGNPRGGGIK